MGPIEFVDSGSFNAEMLDWYVAPGSMIERAGQSTRTFLNGAATDSSRPQSQ